MSDINMENWRKGINLVLGECVDLIEADLRENPDRPRGRDGVTVAYRCMWIMMGFTRDPRNHFVSEGESKLIRNMNERGFTMGELAYIFNRSKSTIHKHVSGPQMVASIENR